MSNHSSQQSGERLLSLDLFRGLTMFFLVLEGTSFYDHALEYSSDGSIIHSIVLQFHHHPWNGLRFWDLIQPYFMFIVGVAMMFSISNRLKKGTSQNIITKHIIIRCIILFFFGVILHCGYAGKIVWELWNVLTQLAFTILIAYSIHKLKIRYQFIISVLLLILTEIMYRYSNIPGFDQPFTMGKNFGSYMDLVTMNKINDGGWVFINFIPTAAHTIWGVIAGKILLSNRDSLTKSKILLITGIAGILVGYGMDITGITPVIKRICTSSFVIVSGGWCLITLAALYWLVDIKQMNKGIKIFTIVGMNSIFIYMFSQTLGWQWLSGFMNIFTSGFTGVLSLDIKLETLLNSIFMFAIELYLCYWLYKKKIFFKI